MAKKKNPKIPSPNDEDGGFSPNPNTNPPPPSSVIPLDDANLNKFFDALEKMGASIEKTNTLLSEKKGIESGTGAFSPEEKKQLEEITQKLQEEIALQNEVLLEMRQTKNSIGGVQSQSVQENIVSLPSGINGQPVDVPIEKMELSQVLKKENDVLTTLNTNIIELKTLQDEVKEVVVKNYEKTVSLADTSDVAKKLKTDGGGRKSTVDLTTKTLQNEIKDDELLSQDKKTMSVNELNHRQIIEKLDRLYAANTAEIVLIKTMIEQQKFQSRHDFENKVEQENKVDEEISNTEEHHKEQLAAHKENENLSNEQLEATKETNQSLRELIDHQKEQAEGGLFNSLVHMIKHVVKNILIFGGIGVAIGATAAYITKYLKEMYWLMTPLINLVKAGFNSTQFGTFVLDGFMTIFKAVKSPIVEFFVGIGKTLETFASFKIAGAGRILSGVLGSLGAPLMSLLGGFFNLGHIITGVKVGFRTTMGVLNKIFWPLQILLSVIDAVIGSIKGFKLGGIKGAVMGAVAEIIDGLTFGLLDFEMMFHFFNEYMSTFFDGLTAAIQPTIDLFMEVWDILVDIFDDFVSLFTGDGGWAAKIGKILGSLTGNLLRIVVSLIKWAGTTLYKVLIEFPYKIGVWLNETIVRLWNWAKSGEWIEDLNKVGLYMAEVMHKLIDNFFSAFMKPLTKLPGVVGESIAGMFGPTGTMYYRKAVVEKIAEEAKEAKKEEQKEKEKTNANFSDFSKNLAGFAKDLPNIFSNMFKEENGGLDQLFGTFGTNLDGFIQENAKKIDTALSKAGAEGEIISPMRRADYVSSDKIRGMAVMVSEKSRSQAAGVVAINNSPTNISNGGSQQPIMISPVSSRNNDPTYHGLSLASAVAF